LKTEEAAGQRIIFPKMTISPPSSLSGRLAFEVLLVSRRHLGAMPESLAERDGLRRNPPAHCHPLDIS